MRLCHRLPSAFHIYVHNILWQTTPTIPHWTETLSLSLIQFVRHFWHPRSWEWQGSHYPSFSIAPLTWKEKKKGPKPNPPSTTAFAWTSWYLLTFALPWSGTFFEKIVLESFANLPKLTKKIPTWSILIILLYTLWNNQWPLVLDNWQGLASIVISLVLDRHHAFLLKHQLTHSAQWMSIALKLQVVRPS